MGFDYRIRCSIIFIFIWLFFFTRESDGLEFRLFNADPLCLVDDSPGHRMVAQYERLPRSEGGRGHDVLLQVLRSDGSVVYSETMKPGRRFLDIEKKGNSEDEMYRVCCSVVTKNFHTERMEGERIRLIIYDAGSMPVSSSDVRISERQLVDGEAVYSFADSSGQLRSMLVPKEQLEQNERSVIQMQQRMEGILKELESGTAKELEMRHTTESTFTRVWVSALVLILVISSVVTIQYRFMISTIKKKKLL